MEAKKLPAFSKMTLEEIAMFKVEFKEPLDETLSIKVHSADLARLKVLARKRGLDHATPVRAWIKEKLESELKKQGCPTSSRAT